MNHNKTMLESRILTKILLESRESKTSHPHRLGFIQKTADNVVSVGQRQKANEEVNSKVNHFGLFKSVKLDTARLVPPPANLTSPYWASASAEIITLMSFHCMENQNNLRHVNVENPEICSKVSAIYSAGNLTENFRPLRKFLGFCDLLLFRIF